MKRHFETWHGGVKVEILDEDAKDVSVPDPWCQNWKEILIDENIKPEVAKFGRGKKTLRDGRQQKSVMHDGLNKRE
jgi:hypothetical protein